MSSELLIYTHAKIRSVNVKSLYVMNYFLFIKQGGDMDELEECMKS